MADLKTEVWNQLRQNGVTLTARMRDEMTIDELMQVASVTHRARQLVRRSRNKIREENW